MGSDFDDVLTGSSGNDILAGGAGLNTLTGGSGADTFVIDPSALTEVGLVDVITDYSQSEGDKIDLGDLLETAFGHAASATDVADNVHLVQTGGNTNVVVDTNGAAPGGDVIVATLNGIHNTVSVLYDDTHQTNVTHP